MAGWHWREAWRHWGLHALAKLLLLILLLRRLSIISHAGHRLRRSLALSHACRQRRQPVWWPPGRSCRRVRWRGPRRVYRMRRRGRRGPLHRRRGAEGGARREGWGQLLLLIARLHRHGRERLGRHAWRQRRGHRLLLLEHGLRAWCRVRRERRGWRLEVLWLWVENLRRGHVYSWRNRRRASRYHWRGRGVRPRCVLGLHRLLVCVLLVEV